MNNSQKLLQKKDKLKQKYIQLIEDAYNFRQTDQALSDLKEFEATLILNEINKLMFVVRDTTFALNV
ncbi:Lacal_2735 family protein [Ichthyenterobacterium sp. W332]|uniref:Lacal_2735 family protein n=1 Tax=Microcosmobacter mediterraneus TaxID=3075607 RepID=A0ABU2YQC2_9FLAO|nr:Lacal_2735 family protein [Ichthyenterobacterium sp. W332]MDT0559258.1 Lacal_2735 family protein [Ichthyenterobacterium sp. W332]